MPMSSPCGVIIYFHLLSFPLNSSLLNIFHGAPFHPIWLMKAEKQRDKELVEFPWMADFIVTSCEFDSFTDCWRRGLL